MNVVGLLTSGGGYVKRLYWGGGCGFKRLQALKLARRLHYTPLHQHVFKGSAHVVCQLRQEGDQLQDRLLRARLERENDES
jgi:hypothetical protein